MKAISIDHSLPDLSSSFTRLLFFALSFVLLFIFQSTSAQAQYAIGISAITANTQTVDTYSATELDPVANYYYDPYVEGYLYQKRNTSLDWNLIRSGSAYGGSDYIAYGYMSAPTEIFSRYQHESDHYVVSYYYEYEPCCGYYFYNPGGYGFASNDGTQWPSGYQFAPGPAPVWIQSQYLYLGTTAVQIPVYPPNIETIQPTALQRGQSGTIHLYGQFMSNVYQAQLSNMSGVSLSISYISESQVDLQISVSSTATTGARLLTLTNTFGNSNQEDFTIADPTPVITGVSPSTWEAGTNVDITITGNWFGTNPSLQISGGGISYQITSANDTQIQASLSISPNAVAGPRALTVVSGGFGGTPFLPAPGTSPNSNSATCQVVQPSVTLGTLSSILKGNSRVIDVTVSSIANQRATVTLKTRSGSGAARFADDSTSKEVGVGVSTLEIKGVTESSDVDNLYVEAKIAGVTREENFTVIILKLKEVSYSGDNYKTVFTDDAVPYNPPHWQDNSSPVNGTADDEGDKKLPVAFKKKSLVTYTVSFAPAPSASLDGLSVKVRSSLNGQNEVPETDATVSGNTVTINSVTGRVELPDSVNYLPDYAIDWEVSSNQSWIPAGRSSNKFYVLLNLPLQKLTLRQTLLDIGCQRAAGHTDENQILSDIWGAFSSRQVFRKHYNLRQQEIGSELMFYYKSNMTTNQNGDVLLSSPAADGECGAWADLLGFTLRAVGFSLPIDYYQFRPTATSYPQGAPGPAMFLGLYVKNWSFTQGSTPQYPDFPFKNMRAISDAEFKASNRFNWLGTPDVGDLNGIVGQGAAQQPNPKSIFNNHQFLVINGKGYDASYGVIYNTPDAFVAASVDALFAMYKETLNEPDVDLDLNNNGNKTDMNVDIYIYYLKRNPSASLFDKIFEPFEVTTKLQ